MKAVELEQAIGKIPSELQADLSTSLMDLLLTSKNGDKISSPMVKDLLHLWHKDELSTLHGLRLLLETAISVEPQETGNVLISRGLSDLARVLGLGGQK
jgi:hypothetical protein